MLTLAQQQWVNHLSDETFITVVPFDPSSEEKFEKVKAMVHTELGPEITFEHRGASSLGISGQDEIDTYIPVDPKEFDAHIVKLTKVFGEPRKVYPLDRAHFITKVDGKRIDIYLINREASSWLDGVRFEVYLKTHPEDLERYKVLKEKGNGLSVREYYKRKIEFINGILNK